MINTDGTVVRPQDSPLWEQLTDEEKADAVARWVLNKYREAFKEPAK